MTALLKGCASLQHVGSATRVNSFFDPLPRAAIIAVRARSRAGKTGLCGFSTSAFLRLFMDICSNERVARVNRECSLQMVPRGSNARDFFHSVLAWPN